MIVWGVKPPCSACRAVLDDFEAAFRKAYGFDVLYGSDQGRNTDLGQLSAKTELRAKDQSGGTEFRARLTELTI